MKLGIYIDSWQQKDFDLGCLNMRAFLPTPLGIVSVSEQVEMVCRSVEGLRLCACVLISCNGDTENMQHKGSYNGMVVIKNPTE